MANLDYGNIKTDEMLKSLERRLKKEYQLTSKEVEKMLTEYLDEYEEVDSKKSEEVKQGKITEREYTNWRIGLIVASVGWHKVRKQLARKFIDCNVKATGLINEHINITYAFNYNYTAFKLETVTGISTDYKILDNRAVEYIRRKEPKLYPSLPEKSLMKIPKDLRWNEKQLNAHMIEGLSRGESIDKIAKRLPRGVGEENLNGAIRRARTMTTSAENGARFDSAIRAKEYGIVTYYVWIATLDGRTRHTHRECDGEVVEVGKTFSNGLRYPGDTSGDPAELYNCRCVYEEFDAQTSRGASELAFRNTDNFDYDSYEEWKQGKPNYYQEKKKQEQNKGKYARR